MADAVSPLAPDNLTDLLLAEGVRLREEKEAQVTADAEKITEKHKQYTDLEKEIKELKTQKIPEVEAALEAIAEFIRINRTSTKEVDAKKAKYEETLACLRREVEQKELDLRNLNETLSRSQSRVKPGLEWRIWLEKGFSLRPLEDSKRLPTGERNTESLRFTEAKNDPDFIVWLKAKGAEVVADKKKSIDDIIAKAKNLFSGLRMPNFEEAYHTVRQRAETDLKTVVENPNHQSFIADEVQKLHIRLSEIIQAISLMKNNLEKDLKSFLNRPGKIKRVFVREAEDSVIELLNHARREFADDTNPQRAAEWSSVKMPDVFSSIRHIDKNNFETFLRAKIGYLQSVIDERNHDRGILIRAKDEFPKLFSTLKNEAGALHEAEKVMTAFDVKTN